MPKTSARDHIVDRLIAERAPALAATPVWPVLRPMLYGLLHYGKARKMADAMAPLGGRAALDMVSDLLALKVSVTGLERVPRSGRFVAVCNHPTGIADGVAVYDVLKTLRPDIMFYANADAHRVAARFDEVLIPVEWVEEKRTRERTRQTLTQTRDVMEAEQPLMIFPAGRLARRTHGRHATDPDWAPSALSIARKYHAPVLPMHLAGPWPTLFHFFDGFSEELRDITLFHELLNKRGGQYHLTIGPLIPAEAMPAGDVSVAMKAYVEQGLSTDPDRKFP